MGPKRRPPDSVRLFSNLTNYQRDYFGNRNRHKRYDREPIAGRLFDLLSRDLRPDTADGKNGVVKFARGNKKSFYDYLSFHSCTRMCRETKTIEFKVLWYAQNENGPKNENEYVLIPLRLPRDL